MPTYKQLSLFATFVLGCLTLAGGFTSALATEAAGAIKFKNCTINATSLCDGANLTTHAITSAERSAIIPTYAARAGIRPATAAIDLARICRWVDSTTANTTKEIFVPFKSDYEWTNFVTATETANSPSSQLVSLVHCSRPGSIAVTANDPAGGDKPTGGQLDKQCYNSNGTLSTAASSYQIPTYGRAGRTRSEPPTTGNIAFSCYTKSGYGPWQKTVSAINVLGLDADRSGGSTNVAGASDWQVNSILYNVPAINGSCGTSVNGQKLDSAPAGAELCSTGTASTVSGSGPWTWSCTGLFGGSTSSCSAQKKALLCPYASTTGHGASKPLKFGEMHMYYNADSNFGGTDQIKIYNEQTQMVKLCNVGKNANGSCILRQTYVPNYFTAYGGTCWVRNNNGVTSGAWGQTFSGGGTDLGGTAFYQFALCVATEYARRNLPGYANCAPNGINGGLQSPVKVNLTEADAKLVATGHTDFVLTNKDGSMLEGHVPGGLAPDEGWLMVRRDNKPLVYNSGMLNADNWFGDRDHRSMNGYTDLAETFKDFLQTDEYGQRYIPLTKLTEEEKTAALAHKIDYKITNPSADLLILDAKKNTRFASDYFIRIYVDYRKVQEGDAPEVKNYKNVIFEKAVVRTIKGINRVSADQWFIIPLWDNDGNIRKDIPSKIYPATEPAPE